MLFCKAPFIASEEIGSLRISEKLPKEYTSVITLIDFPVEVAASYLCAVLTRKRGPIIIWLKCFYLRLVMILVSIALFYAASKTMDGSVPYLFLLIFEIIFTSLGRTIQFSCTGAFFNTISDDTIGGTYMTLLNTVSNLGGTWPKYFLMKSVDYLTLAHCSGDPSVSCIHQGVDKIKVTGRGLPLSTEDFNCGRCITSKDGYYSTTFLSLAFGIVFIIIFAKKIKSLQSLPAKAWKTGAATPLLSKSE